MIWFHLFKFSCFSLLIVTLLPCSIISILPMSIIHVPALISVQYCGYCTQSICFDLRTNTQSKSCKNNCYQVRDRLGRLAVSKAAFLLTFPHRLGTLRGPGSKWNSFIPSEQIQVEAVKSRQLNRHIFSTDTNLAARNTREEETDVHWRLLLLLSRTALAQLGLLQWCCNGNTCHRGTAQCGVAKSDRPGQAGNPFYDSWSAARCTPKFIVQAWELLIFISNLWWENNCSPLKPKFSGVRGLVCNSSIFQWSEIIEEKTLPSFDLGSGQLRDSDMQRTTCRLF